MPQQALKQTEGDTDYELNEDFKSCWITVNNISVYVSREDDGVSVDLLPLGKEDKLPIASTYATFAAASEDN
tara:strand:+ start:443 stop:658 length:216 start_codon:yes stop_codon:yes gene_type:complete